LLRHTPRRDQFEVVEDALKFDECCHLSTVHGGLGVDNVYAGVYIMGMNTTTTARIGHANTRHIVISGDNHVACRGNLPVHLSDFQTSAIVTCKACQNRQPEFTPAPPVATKRRKNCYAIGCETESVFGKNGLCEEHAYC
jgi:hypothetical protein